MAKGSRKAVAAPRTHPALSATPVYGTNDGRHLYPYLNIALLNVVLNLLARAKAGPPCVPSA